MGYNRKLLQDDEEMAVDIQPHWWFFARQIFTAVPLVTIGVLLAAWDGGDARRYLLYLWAVAAVVWAGWLLIKYLDWRFTFFVVTNERVIFRTGVIAKRGVEIPLGRINNINFKQDVWERIIGAGDLEIESAGKDGQSVFEDVRHPDGVQQEIYRQIEIYERRRASWHATPADATAPPAAAAPSAADQIEQLARLRDQGVLSEEEFQTKKTELLGRM